METQKILVDAMNGQEQFVQDVQTKLTACKAVGPESGGLGETTKAEYIASLLQSFGITDIMHLDAPDERVPAKSRPNLIATIPGASTQALWLFAHMDVVPEGDLSLWHSDPWTVVREGDVLRGRGVEDNQQALTSMLLLAKTIAETKTIPQRTLKLVFMSDEECGSAYGLGYMLTSRPDLFPKEDLYIVPDGGAASGAEIEVAEKAILYLKVTVTGKQCHASMPDKGVNALVGAADIILTLTGLAKDFNTKDPLFSPPRSTFTPTRHEANVSGLNIMPGREVFWIDCRLLPNVDPDAVLERAQARASEVAKRRNVEVLVEKTRLERSSFTPVNAPVVSLLGKTLLSFGIEPHCVGIGGGTVAALLRHQGRDACVWSTIAGCCHEPNEYSSIAATIKDAQIFATMAMVK